MDIRTKRLREAFDASGFTQTEICERTGITKGALSSYLSGRYFPKQKSLEKLANILSVSIPYLMGAEEEPKSNIFNAPMIKVPIYGSIHAGTPCGIDNNRDGEMIFPQDFLRTGYDYVSLRVHGDSMEPEYRDGDVVLIRLDTDIKSGDICSVFINGEDAVLKKVLQVDGGYILQPLNSNYEPMFFTAIDDSTGSFRIHGIVDGLFRR